MKPPTGQREPLTDARFDDFLRACERVNRPVTFTNGYTGVLGYLTIDPRDMRSMIAEIRQSRASSEAHRRSAAGFEERARAFFEKSPYTCSQCAGPLPNIDCGHRFNGVHPCCVPERESPVDDLASLLATVHASARAEGHRAGMEEAAGIADDHAKYGVAAAIRGKAKEGG